MKRPANAIPGRRAPSVAALMTIKDVTEIDAHAIRKTWFLVSNRPTARADIDRVLRTHGVEFMGVHKRTGMDVYYANSGDSYAPTVLFSGLRAWVGCWADLAERDAVRDPNQL